MTEPAAPAPTRASLLVVAGVMAAAAAGLVAWSGGFGARVSGEDLYAAFLPKYHYVAESLRARRFPFWNPYEYCGLPLFATGYVAALYAPLVLANVLLPPLQALRAVHDLHLAVFILLTLVYLAREEVGLSAASVGAAIAVSSVFNGVALTGIDSPHFLYSVTYLPAILLAWDGIVDGRPGAAPALAVLAGVQWLPGYPEFPMETAVVLAVFVALGRGGNPWRLVLAMMLLALGAMLAAVQVVPLAETVAESVRRDDVGTYAGNRELLFGIRSPGHLVDQMLTRYGGASVYCLLLGLTRRSRLRLAWAFAFLWGTLPVNRPFGWLYAVWPFSGVRFAFGWNVMAPFFAGCLAASGVSRLRSARNPTRPWAETLAGVSVAGLAVCVGQWHQGLAALACALPTWSSARRWVWSIPVALVAFHAAGLMSGIGIRPRAPVPDASLLEPRAAVLRSLRAAIPGEPRILAGPELRAGLVITGRLPSPNGYEPALAPRRTARLGKHLGLDHFSWGGENLMKSWAQLAVSPGAARALGIGLVAATPLQARPLLASGYVVQARLPDGNLALYQATPGRFHVVHAVVRAVDEEDAFRRVTDPAFDPGASVVLEGEEVPEVAPDDRADDEVAVVDEAPERIRLRARLGGAGVLVVADTYFPGWEARVDRRPSAILRANYAFRALALAAGAHDVELAYRPRSFRIGVALSLAGLVLVAALWWSAVTLARRHARV